MGGLAFAWAMARRRTKEHRHKVDAATRCSGVCPHIPDLTLYLDLQNLSDDGSVVMFYRGIADYGEAP